MERSLLFPSFFIFYFYFFGAPKMQRNDAMAWPYPIAQLSLGMWTAFSHGSIMSAEKEGQQPAAGEPEPAFTVIVNWQFYRDRDHQAGTAHLERSPVAE
jgi:hypothetical protein